ncbi:mucin-17 isoform X1 [Rhagoletis pomonella]|uniref:mucin-17 isoform X1 n=1 Tax=Rhagoletis pomonella TaxID=28610 RepID=UPI0017863E81|nr:mucin-17 isoform X1 [Rhagoletis pomonella]
MPIQLDKILADIAKEKVLRPNYPEAGKKEVDDAWSRVGKNNKLSVHEARSIFKVLQKKYEQEKTKRTPSWKLFDLMEQIHQPVKEEEPKADEDGMMSMEEDEEYEMLEVQEEEEPVAPQGKIPPATSDGESPSKSMKSGGSPETTPEKDEKPLAKVPAKSTKATVASATPAPKKASSPASEEKKVLNTLAPSTRTALNTGGNSSPALNTSTAATAAALHKKGITMKKTSLNTATAPTGSNTPRSTQSSSNNPEQKNTIRVGGQVLGVGETIPLPESIKRKLAESQRGTPPAKKPNNVQSPREVSPAKSTATTTAPTPTVRTAAAINASSSGALQENTLTISHAQSLNIKQEPIDQNSPPAGINLITITGNPRVELTNGGVGGGPSSSTAATVASTSTNGFSPRLEEIDFRNDIIFDAGNGPINGPVTGAANHPNQTNAPGGIINLGNFDNSLPPTFFKNLCNSSRHEALGLYVANVMNRLRPRSAAKLELGILRAIIDVQSDELEQ